MLSDESLSSQGLNQSILMVKKHNTYIQPRFQQSEVVISCRKKGCSCWTSVLDNKHFSSIREATMTYTCFFRTLLRIQKGRLVWTFWEILLVVFRYSLKLFLLTEWHNTQSNNTFMPMYLEFFYQDLTRFYKTTL